MQDHRKNRIKSWQKTFLMLAAIAFTLTGMGQEITSKKIALPEEGLEMHYLQAGHGNTKWVLIHGLGSYAKAYTKLMGALPKGVEAYALDLPGFGDTPKGNQKTTMAAYAKVLDAFVRALDLDDVVLMGHSMGGQIAMTAALENPDWLKEMVLLAPAGIERFTEEDRQWLRTVTTEALYLNLTDAQIRHNFNINFYGGQLPKEALFMYEDRLKIKQDKDAYAAYCATIVGCVQGMLSAPVYSQLERIQVPTLVLFGKNDALIPNRILHPTLTLEQMMADLHKDHPRIQSKLLDQAGHFIIWDQANGIIKETEQFTQTP